MELLEHEKKAVLEMHNGCILCGGVGSGKSITALAYYFKVYGGDPESLSHSYMKNPADLYIITTPKKRDSHEWDKELSAFMLNRNPELNYYGNKVVVDSWNNIGKYRKVKNSFFIFDEQRVVGYGAWSSSFIHISKSNKWILASATPGDRWEDYLSVFIANGYFRTKKEFIDRHVVYDHHVTKFPKIDRYLDTRRLERLRDAVLVIMEFDRHTTRHHEDVIVRYNSGEYRNTVKNLWNDDLNKPIENSSELCVCLKKIVYADESRQAAFMALLEDHPRCVVFYNYDFELDILRELLENGGFTFAEWNGHKHQPIPDTDSWVYLVNYNAGAEGWNCTLTDTMIFYSENYSYRIMEQACGRIDRMNTPYTDLYYYHLRCISGIDLAVHAAITRKKKFNETAYIRKRYGYSGGTHANSNNVRQPSRICNHAGQRNRR